MTKKLNEGALHNELAGSVFFNQPVQPEQDPSPTPQHGTRSPQAASVQPPAAETRPAAAPAQPKPVDRDHLSPLSVRPYGRRPVRRTSTRYAFEFYQDQIEALRSLSLEQKLQGRNGSMSEMVREAIDTYIARMLNRTDVG